MGRHSSRNDGGHPAWAASQFANYPYNLIAAAIAEWAAGEQVAIAGAYAPSSGLCGDVAEVGDEAVAPGAGTSSRRGQAGVRLRQTASRAMMR